MIPDLFAHYFSSARKRALPVTARFFCCLALAFACNVFGPATRAVAASLEAMAGQMIMTGFRGAGQAPIEKELEDLLEDIASGRIGGVILFEPDFLTGQQRNIVSSKQTARLAAMLQERAPVPLFIGVDQEGGKVRRFKAEHGIAPTPSAFDLGRGTPEATKNEAARLGRALRLAGINLNFAPCLDVNVNPKSPAIGALGRSFSANPDTVAAHGLAFAQGLASEGVIPCYKHFPGHGSASGDTHLGLADISATWSAKELLPYRRILPQTPPAMVMPGHIVHSKESEGLPASLSRYAISTLLREALGWNGVVITDDLQMKAVEEQYPLKEALRLAVLAGADILLLGNNLRHDPHEGRKAHAALLELVREGALPEARISESYRRIMLLKRAAGYYETARHVPRPGSARR